MLRSQEKPMSWSLAIPLCRYVSVAVFVIVLFAGFSDDVRSEDAAAGMTVGNQTNVSRKERIRSGPEIGSTIHQFFVRAVTGPHRNRSVCYVCRYGSRPVVMVLIQQSDPKVATLLKAVDELVDDNRISGLRSFGVLVTDESAQAVPVLQTLAFDERIRMPLTAATTAIAGPGCHNLHEEAATTVILYRNQQAVRNFAFARGQISEASIQPLVKGIRQMLEESLSN